jgi:hypothetical protein
MSSAILTSPPTATARLVVDTDVASFIFKWHPEFAPRYVNIVRGSELIVSFMTLAEMRQGALDANWGPRKCAVLEAYLAARRWSSRRLWLQTTPRTTAIWTSFRLFPPQPDNRPIGTGFGRFLEFLLPRGGDTVPGSSDCVLTRFQNGLVSTNG